MQNSRTKFIQVSQSPVSHFYQKVQPKREEKRKICRTPNHKLSDLVFFPCEVSQKQEAGCPVNQELKTWVTTLYGIFYQYLKIYN